MKWPPKSKLFDGAAGARPSLHGVAVLLLLLLGACADGSPEGGGAGEAGRDQPLTSTSAVDTAHPSEVDNLPEDDRWVSGEIRREYQPSGNVTAIDIRAASHPGFDRFVVTFAGDEFPAYLAEISNGPAIQCGSGEPVELPGNGVLTLRLESARAHDDAGSGTLPIRDLQPGLMSLLEARLICDFEGQLEWAFGVAEPSSFRVLELTDPTRIVLDIRHR